MGIVGDHPETGVRIEVERALEGGPPWCYRGEAVTPNARFPITATLSASGEVSVELAPGAPPVLADRARLVVRTAWKHAHEDAVAPPRRIVRWRPEV